jgi:hypothetical protein
MRIKWLIRMNEEVKQVLAFIFKRSGKKILPASDVYLAISMELQWCSPREAKNFVKNEIRSGVLIEQDNGVTPSFEVDEVRIPTGFKPSKHCFIKQDTPKTDLSSGDVVSLMVQRIKNKTNMTEEDITNNIKILAKEKLLSEEVAAIFLGKKKKCDIQDLIPLVRNTLFTSEKNKA